MVSPTETNDLTTYLVFAHITYVLPTCRGSGRNMCITGMSGFCAYKRTYYQHIGFSVYNLI